MTKRRKFTPELKARVVLEMISGMRTSAEACREYQLKPQVLSGWRAKFLEHAATVFERSNRCSEEQVPEVRAQARVAELERLVGRLTLELGVAKKASSVLQAHLSRDGELL